LIRYLQHILEQAEALDGCAGKEREGAESVTLEILGPQKQV